MTASFHDVRFPTDISLGAEGGPGFHTTIQTLSNGYENRNQDWQDARASYTVSHGIKTAAQLSELIKFFRARRGRAFGFRFKDWTDYQLPFPGEATPVLFTTNGTAHQFQLVKVYSSGGINDYTRDLKKIVSGSVTVYNNGSPTTDYTIDLTTGIVDLGTTLRATTGHAIGVTCEFDVPCRFDTDAQMATIRDWDVDEWANVPIIEIRV